MGGLNNSLELVKFFVAKSGEVDLLVIWNWLSRSLNYELISHPKILFCQED